MSTRLAGSRPLSARLRPLLRGCFLLVLLLQAACVTGIPRGRDRDNSSTSPPTTPASLAVTAEPGLESATVYDADFLEPGTVVTRPVRISRAEFQQSFLRLSRDVRLGAKTPQAVARELLHLLPPPEGVETVDSTGDWLLEVYRNQAYTLVPERQEGPVVLTPAADEALRARYLQWCVPRGGGDCLGLLDDGPYLRTDDRRVFALALAFGHVLDETRQTLARELLDVRMLVSTVVWTVTLYCMMWVVPEPTTKALAAGMTLLLMGYLGLETMYGLMDGWARLADTAHHASTFEELRAAGEEFGRVLGEDAARAMILAVATLSGHTLKQVLPRVKSLPGFKLAGKQWKAQGGAAVMGRVEVEETALATEEALAQAIVAVETVATSPQGPLAVVMFKKGTGSGTAKAPGGRSARTVIRHRGGNQQVELSDGQRWHLPRGKSAADLPAQDKVGDMLQDAVTQAAKKWGPDRLSDAEKEAIKKALDKGEYWLARLLEREARGRFVENEVSRQFKHLYNFSRNKGVDVVVPGGYQYEILSGTESNLARHGRRLAGEFFRMLTF
ncbi:hypothetical protein F0U62_34940 [Cystobacter fuscus]|uniref:SitA5 family polymorphic toxin n=1 Tax=Cystobacter fuscus TaxID=43 RepID=UPI002B299045|nr:hypothetical protein F0U62_34940 [Cystobacter fuscus]